MPHVVWISKTFVAAPAQRLLDRLAGGGRWRVTLITPPSWRQDGREDLFHPMPAARFTAITLPIRGNGHFHRYVYHGLGAALSALRPDVVQIDEEPYNPAAWQALYHARRLRRPALLVAWQTIARRYPPPFAWGEAWAYRQASAIIAGNQAAADVVRAKGYRGAICIQGLHGIDPELWTPRALASPAADDAFTIGVVGRLVAEKGVDIAIAALPLLPERCRLRVIGSGPAADSLRALADRLGVVARVEFVGALPPSAMPAAMRALDALALPSRARPNWSEQFGRVLAEAMASGVPVVGAASGEIPAVIGDAGLVVPEGSSAALASALAVLANDPLRWEACARRGLQRARDHFTQAAIAGRLSDLYATMTAGSLERFPEERGNVHSSAWRG